MTCWAAEIVPWLPLLAVGAFMLYEAAWTAWRALLERRRERALRRSMSVSGIQTWDILPTRDDWGRIDNELRDE